MGINPRFTEADIRRMLTERVAKISQAILTQLKYVGESFVKNARQNAAFKDQTGNLRNSIGYLIIQNGSVVYENFKKSATVTTVIRSGRNRGQSKRTNGSNDGVQKARNFANQCASKYPRGFVLIVVAGMEYAAAVEAKGYDVLTNSSIQAKVDLQKAIQRIKGKIPQMR